MLTHIGTQTIKTDMKNDIRVGEIDLRIGYTDGLYYGGQIGY